MITTITSVAIGIIATILALFLAGLAFGHHRRQALRYWQLERRLPDAVRYEDLQARIASLEAEHEALRERLFDAHDTLDEAARKRDWMETVREEIDSLEQQRQEVERVQNELETKQVSLADLQEQYLKQETACKELREQLDQLAEKERDLRRTLEDLHDERAKLEAIKKEIAQLADQKRTAEEELERVKSGANRLREDLESQLRALKREREQAATQQELKQKQLDEFEKKIADLGKQAKELKREQRELTNDVEKLEGRKSSLSGQIPTLESTFSQLSSSLERQAAGPELSKSELWNPIIRMDEERSDRPGELDALKEVAQSLERVGLRFDPRTLNAFHSALKSTGSSPLVTLAGVSGTGKSELPRRYADALGINFLGIAVQPRWDSPHDLFGFYDYLEQRFRPTELTRALLQMDAIGRQSGRGWDYPNEYDQVRLGSQMLLVLLDEMNLARVEYYFSEFLSKLETRRGIDSNDASQRSRAEIVLDVSGRSAQQQPLRLYVGGNVLFVGTMNEDESTQALSDKVIDRSNVLRFGSPREIAPLKRPSSNGAARQGNRLQFEQWQSWCKTMHDLEDGDKQRLLEWIRQIREALDTIGRPFAYRVVNAILEYAANYPEVENRVEHAIADQIEQRVLPKLIGLDLHQAGSTKALSAIARVLDEIEDDKLKEQIQKNRREDYFQWTGLDRTAV